MDSRVRRLRRRRKANQLFESDLGNKRFQDKMIDSPSRNTATRLPTVVTSQSMSPTIPSNEFSLPYRSARCFILVPLRFQPRIINQESQWVVKALLLLHSTLDWRTEKPKPKQYRLRHVTKDCLSPCAIHILYAPGSTGVLHFSQNRYRSLL
jgi:hypothetical protein